MDTAFQLAPRPAIPIQGGGTTYPVGRIFCVGRNYADHAREMGEDDREPPFFFTKFPTAAVPCPPGRSVDVAYPPATEDLHHEVELAVAIGVSGQDVPVETALSLVFGYAVAIDLTRRDLQSTYKAKGLPWDMAKNFSGAAPIGAMHRVETDGHPAGDAAIRLRVDGTVRQDGQLKQMTWSVPEIIAHLSRHEPLHPGDLIFTGTPAGVGAISPGNSLEAEIDGLTPLSVRIIGAG